ncbi:MAG: magnesium transporter CorA family protein [Bacteroidales bacterium]|jgi:magnesium transporter|nr:magnesium transporter CorA family protein [Bacteroidales bacterium]MBQ4477469.1 magnesium transporter CorA family protein [Bacteroidales bacterium]MBR4453305.1 magnesium transporter CorA family protein [Bacteroidales bacterium]MCR5555759.1 magnesium transporter CorA family protein [Bacteroidales bacterium]
MIDTLTLGKLKWLHVQHPTDEDFDKLQDEYDFHPLDIEDCRSYTQRPKVDIYDNYYFLILHFPHFDNQKRFIRAKEVKIFWGKDYIITIGHSHWIVEDLFNYYKQNPMASEGLIAKSSDAILYNLLNRLINESYLLVSRVGQEIDEINREMFDEKSTNTIEKISVARRNIIQLNTIFKPQLRVFHKFESGDIQGYEQTEDMEDYWGNILDIYQKMWDMIEDFEDLTFSLSQTFDSLQANKTNETMKVLTLISTIMLPITFLTSAYGMNVELPLANYPSAFWMIMGFSIVLVIIFIIFFKKKKWI